MVLSKLKKICTDPSFYTFLHFKRRFKIIYEYNLKNNLYIIMINEEEISELYNFNYNCLYNNIKNEEEKKYKFFIIKHIFAIIKYILHIGNIFYIF